MILVYYYMIGSVNAFAEISFNAGHKCYKQLVNILSYYTIDQNLLCYRFRTSITLLASYYIFG